MVDIFNLLLADAAGRAMGRFGLFVMDSIIGLVYLIWTLIARITDWLQTGFELLAGANRTPVGQDTVSMIINNRAVQSVFWNLVSVCTALMVFFTIIKIIMDQYSTKAKGGNPYKQVFTMFKGMLLYFFITGFVMVAMYASGIIFKALKDATGGGSTAISAIVWRTMAYDANRLRIGSTGGSDGEGEGGGNIDFDASDERFYRLTPDASTKYATDWDKKKMVLIELGPKGQTGTFQADTSDLYAWGYKQDDGSVIPINTMAQEDESVTWRDGTIYDESLWGSGFADSEGYAGTFSGYSETDGRYGAGASGASQTTFNNPLMEAVVVTVDVGIDARFQPLYYVKKSFPLKPVDGGESQGNLHVTALGSGLLVDYGMLKYYYDNNGQEPGYGYEKFDGNEYSKLSFDISAGMSFNSGGANMGFSIGTFSPAFGDLIAELMYQNTIAMFGDVLMTTLSGLKFPFGVSLMGFTVVDGQKLMRAVGEPLVGAGMDSILSQFPLKMKSPFEVTEAGGVGISFLRPMGFDEFKEFWLETAGQLFNEDHTAGAGAGVWGSTGALAKAREYEKDYGFGVDPETGEERGGSAAVEEMVAEYERAAQDVVAQIKEQLQWTTYNVSLSNSETQNISGTMDGVDLSSALYEYLFNAAFLTEVKGSNNYDTRLEDDLVTQLDRRQTALKNAITSVVHSNAYKKVLNGDRPAFPAEPAILSGEQTVYNPMVIAKGAYDYDNTGAVTPGSGNAGFIIDLHPETKTVNGVERLYLNRTIDWGAYGQAGGTVDFMNSGNLQKRQIDFTKYINQYMAELSNRFDNPTTDAVILEELAVIAGEIQRIFVEEYDLSQSGQPTLGGGFGGISFAEEDVLYGIEQPARGEGNSLGQLLNPQSAEESTVPVAELSTAESDTSTRVWDNSTVSFVNLQDGTETANALKDWVKSYKTIDIGRMFDVVKQSPVYALSSAGNVLSSVAVGDNMGYPPGGIDDTAAAIDNLMSGVPGFTAPSGRAYVLALANFRANNVAALTETYNGTQTTGYAGYDDYGWPIPVESKVSTINSILGVPSYYKMSTVRFLYDYGRMDYVTGFICILVAMGVYMNFTFGLIQRLLNLAVLYLISPITLAFYPFDEGAKFNSNFMQPFYKNVVSAYSLVISMNLFFVLFDVIREGVTQTFQAARASTLMTSFFGAITTLALVSMLPKVKDMLNGVLGGENIESKSLGSVVGDAKKAAGDGIGQIAGAAKAAGKFAGKVGKPIGTFAKRLGVNMDKRSAAERFASKKDSYIAKKTGQNMEKAIMKEVGGKANWDKLSESQQLALQAKHEGKAADKAQKQYGRKMVGSKIASALDPMKNVGRAANAVGTVGGAVTGGIGKILDKTAVGQSIKEMVLVGDGGLSKFANAHTAEGMMAERKKYEDKRTSYEIARQDISGTGNKQIGMAIEMERRARQLDASGDGAGAEKLREKSKEFLALGQSKEGFKGNAATIAQMAAKVDAAGGDLTVVQGDINKNTDLAAVSRARVMDQVFQRSVAGSVAQGRAEEVKGEFNKLNPNVQQAVSQIWVANQNDPKAMQDALRGLIQGNSGMKDDKGNLMPPMPSVQGFLSAVISNTGTVPSSGASMAAFEQMNATIGKTITESMSKQSANFASSFEKYGAQQENAIQALERTLQAKTFGKDNNSGVNEGIAALLSEVKKNATDDKAVQEKLAIAMGEVSADKGHSDFDKSALMAHLDKLADSVTGKKQAEAGMNTTSNIVKRANDMSVRAAGTSSFNNATGPKGGAGA